MPKTKRQVTLQWATRKLEASPSPFVTVFEHGTLQVELYAPEGRDLQTPHTRDEVYVVVSGSGTYVHDGERNAFGPGDFLFAEAGVEHRFQDFSEDFRVWVLFYGPEGGEA